MPTENNNKVLHNMITKYSPHSVLISEISITICQNKTTTKGFTTSIWTIESKIILTMYIIKIVQKKVPFDSTRISLTNLKDAEKAAILL